MPFWQRLIPDLKVIVCIRNPLEVARSLVVRGNLKITAPLQLWLTHYRRVLSATRPENRLVTHYRSYFHNPRAELSRVLDWLGLEVSDEKLEGACAHVSTGLRHHHITAGELVGAGAADEVLGTYFSLCAAAGPIYTQARQDETAGELERAALRDKEINAFVNELQRLRDDYELLGEASAARERLLDEILNSKSFRLVSLYWRMRRGR